VLFREFVGVVCVHESPRVDVWAFTP
jgi:hypothetical protein